MPWFHLNLRRGQVLAAPDDEGAEFAGLEEAYLEAFEGAREIWPELLRNRQDPRQYSYEITDRHGVLLMEVPFVEILKSCRSVPPLSVHDASKADGGILNKHAFSKAVEDARNLNRQMAEVLAGLGAARDSINELRESTQAVLKELKGVE